MGYTQFILPVALSMKSFNWGIHNAIMRNQREDVPNFPATNVIDPYGPNVESNFELRMVPRWPVMGLLYGYSSTYTKIRYWYHI